jgi:hypothetical protein
MFERRKKAGLLALAVAAVSALAFASTAYSVPVTNACKNSVTSNNSQLGSDTSGASPASVPAGATVPLTGLQQQLSVPGAIFVAGYNLGLLDVGDNTIAINARTVIEGTNTVQGQQSTAPVGGVPPDGSLTVTTTISDPDTTPGTGDETATDAVGNLTYPDLSWTAGPSGPIQFREDTITGLAPNVGGIIVTAAIPGMTPGTFLFVQFRCSPGTVTGPDPGTISFIDPAPAFASAQVVSAPTSNPACAALKKKLKKAKKKHNKAKVKKIRSQMRKLGC